VSRIRKKILPLQRQKTVKIQVRRNEIKIKRKKRIRNTRSTRNIRRSRRRNKKKLLLLMRRRLMMTKTMQKAKMKKSLR